MRGQNVGAARRNLLRGGRFCKVFLPQWEAYLLSNGSAPRGPKPGLCVSEVITILLMLLHGSGSKYLKSFYNGVIGTLTYLAPANCFLLEHSPKGFDEKSQTPYKNHDDKGQKYGPSNYSDSSVCAVCASFF
jgi:hypothetical protein